jgi:hypothetical protein
MSDRIGNGINVGGAPGQTEANVTSKMGYVEKRACSPLDSRQAWALLEGDQKVGRGRKKIQDIPRAKNE